MNNLKTELLAQLEQELPSLIALKGYGQKKILEFLDEAIDKSYKQGIADSAKDFETHFSKGIPIKEIIKALKENSNQ